MQKQKDVYIVPNWYTTFKKMSEIHPKVTLDIESAKMRNDLNINDSVIFELEKIGIFVGRIVNKTLNIYSEVIHEAIIFGTVNYFFNQNANRLMYQRGSCVILDNCFIGLAFFDPPQQQNQKHLECVTYYYFAESPQSDIFDIESMSVSNLLLLNEYKKVQKSIHHNELVLNNRCTHCLQRFNDFTKNDRLLQHNQQMYIIYPDCDTNDQNQSKPGFNFYNLYEFVPESSKSNGSFRFRSMDQLHQIKSHWFCSIKRIGKVLFDPSSRKICRMIPYESMCNIKYQNADKWDIQLIYQNLEVDQVCQLSDAFFDLDQTSFILNQKQFYLLRQQITSKIKTQLKDYLLQFLNNHLNHRLKGLIIDDKDRKVTMASFSKCWNGFNFKQLTMCKFNQLTKAVILKTLFQLFQSHYLSSNIDNS